MRVLWLLSLFAITGCAGKWVNNGSNNELFGSADSACRVEARSEFPIRNEVAQRTKFEQQVENCKKKEDCDGKKFKVTQVPTIESYAMDVNKDSREDHYIACMKKRGWEKKHPLF